jgi:hypothetical protein
LFLYPVCGDNRSKHIFGFVPAGLGLSRLPPSAPRLTGFSLFASRSVHGSLLPRALDFCRPCLVVGSVSSRALNPRSAGIRRRVSVSVSKPLCCFCRHGSSAEPVRDSAPASVVFGCDYSFARTGFGTRWSFRSKAFFSI